MTAKPSEIRDRGAVRKALSNSRVCAVLTTYLKDTREINEDQRVYKITGGMGVGGVHDIVCYIEGQ